LARVVLLAPLLLLLSIQHHSESAVKISFKTRLTSFVPPFIAAFLVLVIFNNAVHLSAHTESYFSNISKFLLSMGLFSMAASVKFVDLKRIGGKPLLFGISAWIFFGAFSLTVIKSFGI